MKKLYSLVALIAFALCAMTSSPVMATNPEPEPVYDFVGGDISLLPSYEKYNTPYKDLNGQNIPDLITWLVDQCHWNTFRVRIFVNPSDTKKEGVVQDLDYVKPLAKRIKDKGAFLMLDFHYSDTWVDATHIQAPAGWQGLSDSLMADTLGKYTAFVLDELNTIGATPDFVQVGNEIMYGLCGIKVHPYASASDNWTGYTNLLKAGCAAVRAHCPNAQIIIHSDRPTNQQYNRFYYQKLIDLGVDYDIIGLSYYPFWHGYLTAAQVASKSDKNNLAAALTQLATDFPDKDVHIVETAYNYQYWPTSEDVKYDTQDVWPCSKVGQYNFVSDLVAELKWHHPNVKGINYWFPEENGNGGPSWNANTIVINSWLNRGLWDASAHTLNTVGTGTAKTSAVHALGDFLAPFSAIENTTDPSTSAATKRIVNGQLLIERAGRTYTVTGEKIID